MSEPSVTTGGKDCLQNATTLLSKVFETDPVITYMLCSLSPGKRLAYLPRYFNALLTAAALNKAVFEEANDWSSCAVWMLPNHHVDNPWTLLPAGFLPLLWNIGLPGVSRMLWEFSPLSNAAKAKALAKGERYYYLFFIGTRQDSTGKGLASSLIKRYQTIATEEQIPIYLESTTLHSRDIYANLGFKIVEEIVLGKGKAAPDGTTLEGGEGVRCWAMIWRPPS